MTTKVKKVKHTVKAWGIFKKGNIKPWPLDRGTYNIKKQSWKKKWVRRDRMVNSEYIIVPVTITYHLPHTPKRTVSKSK